MPLLQDFTTIGRDVSIYRAPPQSTSDSKPIRDGTPKTTIIICAWFRAIPKHIAKYTARYRLEYPNADIVLIESALRDMVLATGNQHERFNPVIEILRQSQANKDKCILHIFSNGGSDSATKLAEAWHAKQHSPIPLTAMIFDSCPGSPSLQLAAAAIIESCPPSTRWWATILVYIALVTLYAVPSMLGQENAVHHLRKGLNDTALFATSTPRVYLYSDADRMVPAESVKEHAAQAGELGYGVSLERFFKSSHVTHVNEDPTRYWKAVDKLIRG